MYFHRPKHNKIPNWNQMQGTDRGAVRIETQFSARAQQEAHSMKKSIHHSGNIVCIIVSFNSSLSHRTHPEWISPIKDSPLHTAVIWISPPSAAEFNSTRLSSNRSGEIQRWLNQTCVWHLTADKGIIRFMQLEKWADAASSPSASGFDSHVQQNTRRSSEQYVRRVHRHEIRTLCVVLLLYHSEWCRSACYTHDEMNYMIQFVWNCWRGYSVLLSRAWEFHWMNWLALAVWSRRQNKTIQVIDFSAFNLVGAYDGKYVSFDVNIQLKYQLNYTTNEQSQIEKFERIEIIIFFLFLQFLYE